MGEEVSQLRRILVGDAMDRQVVCVSANDLMVQAARKIAEFSITGLPVIDETGRCVGVVSTSDFTRREQNRDPQGHLPTVNIQDILVQDVPGGSYHIEEVIEDRVANHMSSAVQTISPEATLLQAAKYLCLGHVHRLIVVDDSNRPVGLLSTLDVLAALLAVMDD